MQAGNWRWLLSFGILLDSLITFILLVGFLLHTMFCFAYMYNFYQLPEYHTDSRTFRVSPGVADFFFVQAKRTRMLFLTYHATPFELKSIFVCFS